MKTLKYLFFILCLPLFAGCFEDETTVDTVRISEISIDTLKMQKVYNIDQNEELLIPTEGLVSQSERQLPLTYEWEVNYKFYSDSSALRFTGNELGAFPARLKISNEHGSSFYEFTLNINSAYEKGIAILSDNSEGEPLLSIMRELSDREIAEGKKRFFTTNCLAVNNPGVEFPRQPTDFRQRDKQLFISFKDKPSVYALNSKMLNVEKARADKVYGNDKLQPVITALGAGIGEEFDLNKLRYHKIIIMADADVDGAHIRTLLLTFFFRFMRPLIEEGYVYSAVPPLYKLTRGKQQRVAYTDEERDAISSEMRDGNPNVKIDINRYKGLGEMNPHELWETTMDPEKRTLRRITLDDAVKADETFTVLMGEKVEPRKEFIEKNAKYAVNLDY